MKNKGIALISGGSNDAQIADKLWSRKGAISIIASSKGPKPVKGMVVQKKTLDIEMTSKALKEEKEAIVNKKSIWPIEATVNYLGRIRHIEAENDVIEDLIEWAEAKGMNCQ